MKIAVDIDDTLNIVERVKFAEAYITRKNLPFRLVDENAAMFARVYDWTQDDVLTFIREGGITAFTDADVRAGAREALESWKEDGHEIVIVTARPKEWFGNPVNVSRDWLEKRHIPFDGIVAECADKGRYCAENGISVLVDDNLENCLGAQSRGVRAVLAVGKHNADRVKEIAFAGANWRQIDERVRFIANIEWLEELSARACPARESTEYDGWELRSDVWTAHRGNCIRVAKPSVRPLAEKITACEDIYRAAGKPCCFRLTPLDRLLDETLKARGYVLESNADCMVLDKIPVYFRTGNIRVYSEPCEEWLRAFLSVSETGGTPRAYSLIGDRTIYAAVFDGDTPVAAGMGVLNGDAAGLYDIRVHKQFRRKGYGRALCERILAEAKRAGARQAYLHVSVINGAAVALYKSMGFVRSYPYWYRAKRG